jgi:hydrogenase expression/formation protein HypC
MCLAIPGRIVDLSDDSGQLGRVDVAGVVRSVNVGLIVDDGLEVGDWVLIHVGFAMSVIDEEEAAQTMEVLQLLGEDFTDELEAMTRAAPE